MFQVFVSKLSTPNPFVHPTSTPCVRLGVGPALRDHRLGDKDPRRAQLATRGAGTRIRYCHRGFWSTCRWKSVTGVACEEKVVPTQNKQTSKQAKNTHRTLEHSGDVYCKLPFIMTSAKTSTVCARSKKTKNVPKWPALQIEDLRMLWQQLHTARQASEP